jgi:hypothetical protein
MVEGIKISYSRNGMETKRKVLWKDQEYLIKYSISEVTALRAKMHLLYERRLLEAQWVPNLEVHLKD